MTAITATGEKVEIIGIEFNQINHDDSDRCERMLKMEDTIGKCHDCSRSILRGEAKQTIGVATPKKERGESWDGTPIYRCASCTLEKAKMRRGTLVELNRVLRPLKRKEEA